MRDNAPIWNSRYWFLDHPPTGAAVWVFKVVHFQSDGRFHSLQFPSGFTLRLLVRGTGKVIVDGKEYSAKAGSYFCAIPGVLLHFSDTLEEPWEWWEWQLSGPGALDYLTALGVSQNHALQPAARPAEAARTLQTLLEYFDDPHRQPYHAVSLLYEAGYHCAPAGLLQPEPPRRQQLIQEAQALLDSRLENGVNIDEIAVSLGVDRTTLLRAFRQYLGLSPLEYLQKRRLSRARDLLQTSTLPIREVARHTGFSTDKYFIRVFREATGFTPAVWRKNPTYPTEIAAKK